jgi:hypothetical protein
MSEEEAKAHAALAAQAQALGLAEWQLRAALAVPDNLIRDIVNDNRNRQPTKAEPEPSAEPVRGGGTTPLRVPSKFETDLVDRLVAHHVGGPNQIK